MGGFGLTSQSIFLKNGVHPSTRVVQSVQPFLRSFLTKKWSHDQNKSRQNQQNLQCFHKGTWVNSWTSLKTTLQIIMCDWSNIRRNWLKMLIFLIYLYLAGCKCSGLFSPMGGAGVLMLQRGAASGGEADSRQGVGQLYSHCAEQPTSATGWVSVMEPLEETLTSQAVWKNTMMSTEEKKKLNLCCREIQIFILWNSLKNKKTFCWPEM